MQATKKITLLCSPSHACSNRYHIFAADHKSVNFNPVRDISLHLFGGLFLIALLLQSPIKMLTDTIYSMHSLLFTLHGQIYFFLHIESLCNVFFTFMYIHIP